MIRALFALALFLPLAARAADLKTEDQKSLYAIGYVVGSRNLAPLSLKPGELKIVEQGLADGASGKKASIDVDKQMENVNKFAQGRSTAAADKEKVAGRTWLDKAAKEKGAVKLPSGLIYKTLKPGDGPSPAATDKVKVNYEGKLTSGTVFDSSYKRGQPAEFGLNQVIKCWTEGVQKMKVGEKAQLTCPSDIAYGDHGHPPSIPGGATLVFEVELLGIEKVEPPKTPTPPAVAAAAPDGGAEAKSRAGASPTAVSTQAPGGKTGCGSAGDVPILGATVALFFRSRSNRSRSWSWWRVRWAKRPS